NLTEGNLSDASLKAATLRNAAAARANFQAADLTDADLSDANFSETLLVGAHLDGARLFRADFTGAKLRSTDLPGSPSMIRIGLHDATIATTDFGMTTLRGATLPRSAYEFQPALQTVKEMSKNAHGRYVFLLCLCAFAFLTLVTATDAQFVLNTLNLKLPIFNVDLSVRLFCFGVAVLGLLSFLSLHLTLSQLWEVIAELPTYFPDGLHRQRKLYPWALSLLVEEWQHETRQPAKKIGAALDHLRNRAAAFLGWGLLPTTLAVITYRSLIRRDVVLSLLLLFFLTAAVFFSSFFYQRAWTTIQREHRAHPWRLPSYWALATLIFGLVVIGQGFKGELPFTTPSVKLRGIHLEGHEFGAVDLSAADLSFVKLAGADFHGTLLRKASLQ